MIYVLALQGGKYYVGEASNPNSRMVQHLGGRGAEWTKKHPPRADVMPLFLEEGYKPNPFNLRRVTEATVTFHLMLEKGPWNVRGYAWSDSVTDKCSSLPNRPPQGFGYVGQEALDDLFSPVPTALS